jgi:hypothetical protein
MGLRFSVQRCKVPPPASSLPLCLPQPVTLSPDWISCMKVTLERAALLKSLGHVHRVVERRNTIPILSNIFLEAQGQCSYSL